MWCVYIICKVLNTCFLILLEIYISYVIGPADGGFLLIYVCYNITFLLIFRLHTCISIQFDFDVHNDY